MYKKAVFTLIICCSIFSFTKNVEAQKKKIDWLNINEVNAKLQESPRPVLIDLYTDWCYWCKVMDKKTYSDSHVIEYINTHFYAVKLNAETRDSVIWNGKDFEYNVQNKINEFSLYVTQGQLAFPNTVIFPDIKQIPASVPGYMEPQKIEIILRYFGDGVYKTKNFNEYSANFKSTW
jgi:thioredoxin-related protein